MFQINRIICAITYNSDSFESFVEWSSLLLLGFANFSLPLALDLMLRGHHGDVVVGGGVASQNQPIDLVLWVYAFVSGSISSVIIQRITDSLMLAGIGFAFTVGRILHLHQYSKPPKLLAKRSSELVTVDDTAQGMGGDHDGYHLSSPHRKTKTVDTSLFETTPTGQDETMPFLESNHVEIGK